MKKAELELYTDYLISTLESATATGSSSMVEGDVSHDRVTRFLSEREYPSRDLWRQVKPTVRQIEREDGVLIFDDTLQEKAWMDENEVMCSGCRLNHSAHPCASPLSAMHANRLSCRFVLRCYENHP